MWTELGIRRTLLLHRLTFGHNWSGDDGVQLHPVSLFSRRSYAESWRL
jgi:hypothetical protein